MISLEQKRQMQIWNIMFIQSSKGKSRAVTNVNTRRQAKYAKFLRLNQKWELNIRNHLIILEEYCGKD